MEATALQILNQVQSYLEEIFTQKEPASGKLYTVPTLALTFGIANTGSVRNQLYFINEYVSSPTELAVVLHFDPAFAKKDTREQSILWGTQHGAQEQSKQTQIAQWEKEKKAHRPFTGPEEVDDIYGIGYERLGPDSIVGDVPFGKELSQWAYWSESDVLHVFFPYALPTSYEETGDVFARYNAAREKKTFFEFAKECVPRGSFYETLGPFLSNNAFQTLILYNCAYYLTRGPQQKNGELIPRYITQNEHYEAMCELLYLVTNCAIPKKTVLDTEFQHQHGTPAYVHPKSETVTYGTITGTQYPLDETTAFRQKVGGRRRRRTRCRRMRSTHKKKT